MSEPDKEFKSNLLPLRALTTDAFLKHLSRVIDQNGHRIMSQEDAYEAAGRLRDIAGLMGDGRLQPCPKEPAVDIEAPLGAEIVQYCMDLAEFLIEKNKAYGNSVAEPAGIFAKRLDSLAQIDVRIDDKLNRLMKGSEYPGDDTVKDLTGYLVLRQIISKL